MKALAIIKSVTVVGFAALVGLTTVSSASAVQLTENFTFTNELSQRYIANGTGNRWFLGSGTATTVYDTATNVMTLSVNSTGGVYGTNADDSINTAIVFASGVSNTYNLTFTNVTQTNNPYAGSLLATTASGVTGTANISDLGNGTGATYGLTTAAMDFNDPAFAGAVGTHPVYAEMAALNAANGGAASFFQFISPSLGGLNFNTWFRSTTAINAGGLSFAAAAGDMHAHGAVPEPASLGLLSLGLLGGAVKRRRAKAA